MTAAGAAPTIRGVVNDNLKKSRSEKVITAIEGDDEFSIASVDPQERERQRALKLASDDALKVQSTQNERTIWRLFRKIFT